MQLQMGYVSEQRLLKRIKASEHLKQHSRPLANREVHIRIGILSPLIRKAAIKNSETTNAGELWGEGGPYYCW